MFKHMLLYILRVTYKELPLVSVENSTIDFVAYLLLPPASIGRRCRTPGLSRPSPTSTQFSLQTAALCFAPGSLRPHAKPRGAPTPHSHRHPKANKMNTCQTSVKKCWGQFSLHILTVHLYFTFYS